MCGSRSWTMCTLYYIVLIVCSECNVMNVTILILAFFLKKKCKGIVSIIHNKMARQRSFVGQDKLAENALLPELMCFSSFSDSLCGLFHRLCSCRPCIPCDFQYDIVISMFFLNHL